MSSLQVLALEPWLGGSHAAFLESWKRLSRHRVEIVGLADRHWKWRMQAGGWELARKLRDHGPPDVLFVSDYVDLPSLMGFLSSDWRDTPCLLYMHENQLTYPLRPGEPEASRDTSYGFTNILSCVRADAVVFNSTYHKQDFARGAEVLLGRLPKPTPAAELRACLAAAAVISPGVDFSSIPLGPGAPNGGPLRVLFSHRWQFDKDPLEFLKVARDLADSGLEFELVLLGERFVQLPEGVDDLLQRLEPYILHRGFLPSRADYAALIGTCDVSVSTARHEFFGISAVEAMAAGVAPLLPDRLNYPELVGVEAGRSVLYNDPHDCRRRLRAHAEDPGPLRTEESRIPWRDLARRWSVEGTARALDAQCLELREKVELNTP